jgi:hypothetical protein
MYCGPPEGAGSVLVEAADAKVNDGAGFCSAACGVKWGRVAPAVREEVLRLRGEGGKEGEGRYAVELIRGAVDVNAKKSVAKAKLAAAAEAKAAAAAEAAEAEAEAASAAKGKGSAEVVEREEGRVIIGDKGGGKAAEQEEEERLVTVVDVTAWRGARFVNLVTLSDGSQFINPLAAVEGSDQRSSGGGGLQANMSKLKKGLNKLGIGLGADEAAAGGVDSELDDAGGVDIGDIDFDALCAEAEAEAEADAEAAETAKKALTSRTAAFAVPSNLKVCSTGCP